MTDLQLNGVEVRFPVLGHRSFKASGCRCLLSITPDSKDEMLAKLRREGVFGGYSGLWISGIADLGFLQEFSDVLYLEIVDQKRVNAKQLEGLSNLRGLRIETPGAGIDFSWFPELEVFVGDWHVDNSNLGACQELRTLRVWQFKPRSADLSDLAGATRLETLHLVKTDISTLGGVDALEDLRYLTIAYAPKLKSLEALSLGECGVREIGFESVKNVSSFQPLASLPYLRRLKLFSCGSMPDLKWTKGMNRLDQFSFVETNVEGGDLSPLLDLPRLRYVGTMDKKHYNYKFAKLNELLEQRVRPHSDNR